MSVKLNHEVPQSSVGGPLLFSIYLSGLKHVLQSHDFSCHCYADDVQLFVSFAPNQDDALLTFIDLNRALGPATI